MMNTTAVSTRRAFNVREFCAEYGIGRDNAYKAIREGKLIARRLGAKRTIITATDAEAFIAGLPQIELPPKTGAPQVDRELVEGDGSRAPSVRAKVAPAHVGA